ncbi:hypothetical protein HY632_04025 [Candidatus Uhrbacteria bacterium]|nr:hypothetical protein [Candidatus Uhrbacteria bacterium]
MGNRQEFRSRSEETRDASGEQVTDRAAGGLTMVVRSLLERLARQHGDLAQRGEGFSEYMIFRAVSAIPTLLFRYAFLGHGGNALVLLLRSSGDCMMHGRVVIPREMVVACIARSSGAPRTPEGDRRAAMLADWIVAVAAVEPRLLRDFEARPTTEGVYLRYLGLNASESWMHEARSPR